MELYSLPYDDSSNKYFELWRGALARAGIEVRVVPKGSLLRLLFSRVVPGTVLAIHWSTVWYGSSTRDVSAIKLFVNGCALLLLKSKGMKIVWVVHNASAHEYPYPTIDRFGRWCTAQLADAIVAQQEETRAALASQYPKRNVVYIPHGNYVNAYGSRIEEREKIRSEFEYLASDVVLLAFGAVRPYKRIENIIKALSDAHEGMLALVIAGKASQEYERKVLDSIARVPLALRARIRFENRFIPDAELPRYLAIADYAVFFYDDTELTSGGILLALSYGIPVITRTIAGAHMVQNGVNGYVFADEAGLTELLKRLPALVKPEPETVINSVAELDWDMIAKKYLTIL